MRWKYLSDGNPVIQEFNMTAIVSGDEPSTEAEPT